jgi:hypothetical protein
MKPYLPIETIAEINELKKKETDNKAVGWNLKQTIKERGFRW